MTPFHVKPPPAVESACLNNNVPAVEPVQIDITVSVAPSFVAITPVILNRVLAALEKGVTTAVEVMLLFDHVLPAA